jgi:glycosyltransferase involved in cell wall biosynthesis
MEQSIKYSIIMPVWNRADVIARSIESVLHQTYDNFELIIVDDGSDDNLEEVVSPYICENVIFHRIPHSGVSAARNFALLRARGEYIAYLDSDNTWYPNFLSVMGEALDIRDERKKAAYCRCNFYKVVPIFNLRYKRAIRGKVFNFQKLLLKNYIDLNTFVHLRTYIKEIGLFDETLKRLVDWDYIVRITALHEPVFVPEVLVNYYLNVCENSISKRESFRLAYRMVREKNKVYEERTDK